MDTWFLRYASGQTDIQLDTDTLITIFPPPPGRLINGIKPIY